MLVPKVNMMYFSFLEFSFYMRPRWKKVVNRVQVITAFQVQSIRCIVGKLFYPGHNRPLSTSTRGHTSADEQAARVQTSTKRKVIGMKSVVNKGERQKVKDMVLLPTKVVPTGEISH